MKDRVVEQQRHRLGRIFELLEAGIKSTPEIDRLLNSNETGRNSEQRATQAISALPIVLSVLPSTPEEDATMKVDLWTTFKDGSGHAKVGLQVKSSYREVFSAQKKFRSYPPEFKRLIFLVADVDIELKQIRRDFLKQLEDLDNHI